ncbi:MAG: fliN [Bacillota bacterium]|jgi:flagellar motor switch protein FliN/FliY|nr:fliN [Bacillota bacterium]
MTNDNEMYKLTPMEVDVIGEVMNISMGAGATAMSTILDRKVNITTPRIETLGIEEFEFSYLEPVIGVLIKYVEGIDGTNVLLLREEDLKKILGNLLSMDPAEMAELDEIGLSAVSEIMNQMMGSAASALASFLGQIINISPPEILDTTENVKTLFSLTGDSLVSIKFNLSIDGLVDSEFISAMDPLLAKKIVKMSLGASAMEDEADDIAASVSETTHTVPMQEAPAAPPPPASPASAPASAGYAPQTAQAPPGQPIPQAPYSPQPAMQEMQYQQPMYYGELAAPPMYMDPRVAMVDQAPKQQVQAMPYNYKPLGVAQKAAELGIDDNNLELIMSVPVQITVELGKTKKKIKDIAELTVGNIVELNRQAGDQVDVVANGRLIARGDVVVVDDNYSVRITEIIKAKDNAEANK